MRLKSPQLSFKAPLLLQFFHVFGMAIVITADEKAAAFKGAGADLVFLMDKKQVDEDTQAKLYHIGVTTVEQFAVTRRTWRPS